MWLYPVEAYLHQTLLLIDTLHTRNWMKLLIIHCWAHGHPRVVCLKFLVVKKTWPCLLLSQPMQTLVLITVISYSNIWEHLLHGTSIRFPDKTMMRNRTKKVLLSLSCLTTILLACCDCDNWLCHQLDNWFCHQ